MLVGVALGLLIVLLFHRSSPPAPTPSVVADSRSTPPDQSIYMKVPFVEPKKLSRSDATRLLSNFTLALHGHRMVDF